VALQPNIALQVKTPEFTDPLDAYAKAAGVRNLLQQAPMQAAQLERLKAETEQTRLENEGLPAKQAALNAKAQADQKAAEIQAQLHEHDLVSKKAARLGALAGTIKDDATKDFSIGQAHREGLLDDATALQLLKQPYDDKLKSQIDQFASQALSVKEQSDQKRNALLDQIKQDQEKRAAALAGPQLEKATADAALATLTSQGKAPIQPAAQATIDRADKQAKETLRHNQATEKIQQARVGLESSNKAEKLFSQKKLADVVLENPSLYDELTPTDKGHIAGELASRGFEGFGKKPSEAAVKQITQTRNALDGLRELKDTLKANERLIGPVTGLETLLPYATEHKQVQAKIDLVRQRVGKALEGGVLRKEDEEKYKKILATMTDTPDLAISKTESLIADIEREMGNYTDELRRSGRNVKAPTGNGSGKKGDPLGIR